MRYEGDENAWRGGRKCVAMQGWQRRDAEEITSPRSWRYVGTQFKGKRLNFRISGS